VAQLQKRHDYCAKILDPETRERAIERRERERGERDKDVNYYELHCGDVVFLLTVRSAIYSPYEAICTCIYIVCWNSYAV